MLVIELGAEAMRFGPGHQLRAESHAMQPEFLRARPAEIRQLSALGSRLGCARSDDGP